MDASLGGRVQTSGMVAAALQRGTVAGHSGCAIYLPGEVVRCVHPGESGRHHCGGVLFTNGPESVAHVRVYEERRFNERRRVPRGNYKCPKQPHWLEIESHMVSSQVSA